MVENFLFRDGVGKEYEYLERVDLKECRECVTRGCESGERRGRRVRGSGVLVVKEFLRVGKGTLSEETAGVSANDPESIL